MADPTLQHEHEAMTRAANEFSCALDDLNAYVAPVRADHEALDWLSDAAERYRALFQQWLIQFGDICRALETMSDVLGANATAYGANEDWALQYVNGITTAPPVSPTQPVHVIVEKPYNPYPGMPLTPAQRALQGL
ncbi:WXG100 family type VII secretion target [Catenulispora sp. NF23]|uniref:WXG100 family type VII secretion target n=1 Tax=Catenulispora pinistramenti TaxID=2705254 RepID=A0ABS5KZF0_9ACTN|nr:WXG100 family type VII secretion target [Catenulispora pinistramenti]MBS2537417.1 WXG100 family type VII secretion target [Catenulispora pinistramenti]MBS2551450.1 WXG100 family type VII secretion target [Catenulispora pinistramenti]